MFVNMCAEITVENNLNAIRLVNSDSETANKEFSYGLYCNSLSTEYRKKYYFSRSIRKCTMVLPTKCAVETLLAATEIAKISKGIIRMDVEQIGGRGLLIEIDAMRAFIEGVKVTPVEWTEHDCSSWFEETRDEYWSWYEVGKPRYVKVCDQNEILRKMGYGNMYPIYLGVPDLNLRLALA